MSYIQGTLIACFAPLLIAACGPVHAQPAPKQRQQKIEPPDILILAIAGIGQHAAKAQLDGGHLVRPDGTIGLSTFGSVMVSGLTAQEATDAIQARLAKHLPNIRVNIQVKQFGRPGARM